MIHDPYYLFHLISPKVPRSGASAKSTMLDFPTIPDSQGTPKVDFLDGARVNHRGVSGYFWVADVQTNDDKKTCRNALSAGL